MVTIAGAVPAFCACSLSLSVSYALAHGESLPLRRKEHGFHFCSVTWWSKHTTGKWELVIQNHFDWGVIKPGLQFPSEYFRHSTIKQNVGAITNTITPTASLNWHSDNPTHCLNLNMCFSACEQTPLSWCKGNLMAVMDRGADEV